jgi:hypothetical protein
MTNFKSYSEKSKSARALVQVHKLDKEVTGLYLSQQDGKWGFTLNDEGQPMSVGLHHATESPKMDEPAAVVTPTSVPAPQAEEHVEEAPAPSATAFGAFAFTQLTAPSNAAPAEPVRTATSQRVPGLKMDKNREERNGVKERSRGGLCRLVWDTLNSMMTHDEATGLANVPTVADIKKVAEEKGWNVNNASIEYYQWRKFHGISGRGKKQI